MCFKYLWLCVLVGISLIGTGYSTNPSISGDFPDPSIIYTGGAWWAFATSNGGTHVQAATSRDFNSWIYQFGVDMLPNLPPWVSNENPDVWAPNVVQIVSCNLMYSHHRLIYVSLGREYICALL
jgi:beta-xylosidase